MQVATISVPGYPQKTLAAQLLGTVGPITPQEIKEKAYRGVSPNSIIGQSGLEGCLRPLPARHRRRRACSGRRPRPRHGRQLPDQPDRRAQPGALARLQRSSASASRRWQTSIASNTGATAGAFVAMNPTTARSTRWARYRASTRPCSRARCLQSTYRSLTNPNDGDPLLNRAIQSAGPTGSTFKPITATAALQSGDWTHQRHLRRHRPVLLPGATCLHNAGHAVDGSLDLVNAIRVSSDDFFYNLGVPDQRRQPAHPSAAAARSGPVGPDVRDRPADRHRPARRDRPGTLPTPRWRAEQQQARGGVRQRHGSVPLHERAHAQPGQAQGLSPQPQARPRWLRDRRRHQPALVGRRQRQPRRRPGRRPGHAAAARGRLLGAGQRRHDRPAPHRAGRPEPRRHRAAEDRPAAVAPHQHQPVLPGHDPGRACAPPPRSPAVPRPT